ncbi:MAG: aminoacyl-tRNA deacylase [Castellaniella sp.]
MRKPRHVSQTPATTWLSRHGIVFSEHTYDYVEHGGARQAAHALDLDPHSVAKTLIMEDEDTQPLIVIMHGDKAVSTKNLARQIGAKRVSPCQPEVAQRHSGYLVGGTSPFGTRKRMPVWVEAGLLALPAIYLNGGRRGYLIGIDPQALVRTLAAKPVHAAIDL